MDQTLEGILERCTVKIKVSGKSGWGTGFFVDSDLILTCAHVVKGVTSESVQVYWQNQEAFEIAVIEEIYFDPFDIALLRLGSVSNKFPCVYLDTDIRSSDVFYTFGYPEGFENGAPVTFECEGITGDNPPFIIFKHGQTRPGLSGSPLLNKRTGRVCGIVKFTRDRTTNLGGGGILVETVYSKFAGLQYNHQNFHDKDKTWSNALKNSLDKSIEIKSEVGIDYKPLQTLLEAENWVKADEETTRLFRQLTKANTKKLPDILAIKRFPCSDLETIDRLWTTYSRGHFGFSIQQQIWESIEEQSGNSYNIFRQFANQVGWIPGEYDAKVGFLREFFSGKQTDIPIDLSFPEGFVPLVSFLLPALNWFDERELDAVLKDVNPLEIAAIYGKVAGATVGTWLRVRSVHHSHYLHPWMKTMLEGFSKKIWHLYGEHSIALMQRLKICKIK